MENFCDLLKKLSFSLIFSFIISSVTYAENFFYLEGGGLISPLNRVTSSDSASTSLIGSKQILLGLSAKIGDFKPGVDYTILGRSGPSDSYKSKTLIAELPYVSLLGTGELKTGLCVWMNTISGKGGDVTLPNGNSTATFSLPGRSESSRNLGFVFGFEQPLTDEFAFDVDAHILAPLTKRRTFNLILQLSWRMY